MKVGDLIRFTSTGVVGLVTKIHITEAGPVGERVGIYCTYEDEDKGQCSEMQWFTRDYLLQCAEPATLRS